MSQVAQNPTVASSFPAPELGPPDLTLSVEHIMDDMVRCDWRDRGLCKGRSEAMIEGSGSTGTERDVTFQTC